jgi:hypothetical protein
MPVTGDRSAHVYRAVRKQSRLSTAALFGRFADATDHGLYLTAVVEGTLEGVIDWMAQTLGTHTAYEILQRRADALASGVINEERERKT